jgi:rubrerythrin
LTTTTTTTTTTTDYRRVDLSGARLSLTCSVCGYGIVRSVPPERCPMCQRSERWLPTPRAAAGGAGELPRP